MPSILAAATLWLARWRELPSRTRTLALAGAGALAVAAGVIAWIRSGPTEAVLFSDLDARDSAQIVARLTELRVPHRLDEAGHALLVPEERVHDVRLALASEGLPNGDGVGFEIFDAQRFGETEFAEQVKYHRALEGELTRTIAHLEGVRSARVHLVLPTRSVFVTEESSASASIVLDLKPGWQVREDEIRGITHLVASSVRGLDPANVTIVDGSGRRLEAPNEEDGPTMPRALAYKRDVERSVQSSVQAMLDRALGPGRAVTTVGSEVSFSRSEQTEERYEPETIATRSLQTLEERDESSRATQGEGVAGAAANLPGAATTLTGTTTGAPSVTREGVVRRTETRNYEVTKLVRREVMPVGRITRLQVAVVVDGHWRTSGKTKRFEARSADELRRIEALVASAAGLDEARGDRVTVQCLPLASGSAPAEATAVTPFTALAQRDPRWIAAAALFVLAFVGVAFALVRRRRKTASITVTAAVPREGETAASLPTGSAPALAASASPTEVSEPPPDPDQLRVLATELANQDAHRAAQIVRGWLGQDAQ